MLLIPISNSVSQSSASDSSDSVLETLENNEMASDWVDGWQYRKAHQIFGTPGAGENYQVELLVHYGSGTDNGNNVFCDSNCQTDFDDIRFADDDGNTQLDYWRESYYASDNATFWVEVKDNLDYDTTIFVYYGNSTCTTSSNGTATFVFFDDFDDGIIDTSKWETYGPWTETGGVASFSIAGTGGISVLPDLVTDGSWSMQNKSLVSSWRINQLTVNREWGVSCADTIGDDHTRLSYFLATGDIVRSYYDANGVDYDHYEPIIGEYVQSVFMETEIVSVPNNVTKNSWILNGEVVDTYSGTWFDSTPQYIFLGFYVHGYTNTLVSGNIEMEFDYVYLRNQVGVDISHGSWLSTEEWLAGWNYRKSHSIQGAAGAGTNYQIEINVHYGYGIDAGRDVYCEEKCQPDFDDIRFTDNDGITLLDYWTESVVDSNVSTFWVEVADDLSVDTTICMYYGNSTVSSLSNGTATFIFFDDYENNNLDRWDGTTGAGYSCSTDQVVHGTYALKFQATPGADIFKNLTPTGEPLTHDFMVHSWVRDDNQLRGGHVPLVKSQTQWWIYACRGYNTQFSYFQGGADYVHWPYNYTGASNTWFEMEVGLAMSTDEIHAWKSGAYMGSIGLIASNGVTVPDDLYQIGFGQQSSYVTWWDDTYVRKWVENEPMHGGWGESEQVSWHHDCSSTTGFVYNDTWNMNWMTWDIQPGSLTSDGTSLAISGISTGSGYHGPVYEYELPRSLRVRDIQNFTAAMFADNSQSIFLGYQVVMLGDANRNPVLFFSFGDGWSDYRQGAYGVSYVFDDGSRASFGSGYPITWTSFHGEMKVSYTDSGLLAFVEGIGEEMLTGLSESDFNREIKYVALASARFGYDPMFPLYVDDISINYESTSEPTPDETSPSLNHPSDATYEFGSTGHSIIWTVSDPNPGNYTIFRDATMLVYDDWVSGSISINTDGLDIGSYQFTIVVFDAYGNYIADNVRIFVVDTTAPILNHPSDITGDLSLGEIQISWQPTDLLPFNYAIYNNGILAESGIWSSGENLTYTFQPAVASSYNITIIVEDTSGNIATDSVFVNIDQQTIEPFGDVMIVSISIGSFAIIVVVIGMICRNKGGTAPETSVPNDYSW